MAALRINLSKREALQRINLCVAESFYSKNDFSVKKSIIRLKESMLSGQLRNGKCFQLFDDIFKESMNIFRLRIINCLLKNGLIVGLTKRADTFD